MTARRELKNLKMPRSSASSPRRGSAPFGRRPSSWSRAGGELACNIDSFQKVCARPPCGKSPMKDKRACKAIAGFYFNVEMQQHKQLNIAVDASFAPKMAGCRSPTRSSSTSSPAGCTRRACKTSADLHSNVEINTKQRACNMMRISISTLK